MALYPRGDTWWYRFSFNGRQIRESAKTTNRNLALEIEREHYRKLRDGLVGVDSRRQKPTVQELADRYVAEYRVRNPKSVTFIEYTVNHVVRVLGKTRTPEIDIDTIIKYQTTRSNEQASGKTINNEVVLLLRLLDMQGDQLRKQLRRKKLLALPVNKNVGKSYSVTEQDKMLAIAAESNSPSIHFALRLALNCGMRDAEIKNLTWAQVDFTTNMLTVGESKTDAGTGRLVPLNADVMPAFVAHRDWYIKCFRELRPEWYVFPFGRRGRLDPTRPVTTFKTAWTTIRRKAGVTGRWHDTRHTVVTQLGESGAPPAAIMASLGHVSRAMLERYSHANLLVQQRAFAQLNEYRNNQRKLEQAHAAQLAAMTAEVNRKHKRRSAVN